MTNVEFKAKRGIQDFSQFFINDKNQKDLKFFRSYFKVEMVELKKQRMESFIALCNQTESTDSCVFKKIKLFYDSLNTKNKECSAFDLDTLISIVSIKITIDRKVEELYTQVNDSYKYKLKGYSVALAHEYGHAWYNLNNKIESYRNSRKMLDIKAHSIDNPNGIFADNKDAECSNKYENAYQNLKP